MSRSWSIRSRAETRKWWLHSGQTQQVLLDLLAEEGRLAAVAAHPDAFRHPLRLEVPVPGVPSGPSCPSSDLASVLDSWLDPACLMLGCSQSTRPGGVPGMPGSADRQAMPFAEQDGGDLDPFEVAAGPSLVELDAGLAPQVAGDQPGQRLADDQADRLVLMAAEQRPEGRLDPLHRPLDGLALGRTDRRRVVDPLAEHLGVPPLDLVDLEALPEPLIEVAELVDPLGTDAHDLADDLRGPDRVLAGAAVERGQRGVAQALGDLPGHPRRPRRVPAR